MLSLPAYAGEIVGRASVTDGNSLAIQGIPIRLHGIDAPESWQICRDAGGKLYRCGVRAAEALDVLLAASRPTRCRQVDTDRYGRVVAVCWTVSGVEVGEWMVANGWSFDWPKYSRHRYAPAQRVAASKRLGFWSGRFDWPWELRALKRNKRSFPAVAGEW